MVEVNPEILVWARETSGLTIEGAAQKLNIKDTKKKTAVEKLSEFEQGEVIPDRSLLVKMAKQYHRPLLTFYMDKPPIKGDRGQDFRTVVSQHKTYDPILDALIRDITTRQNLVRTGLEEEDAPLLRFIGSMQMSAGVAAVSESIVRTLQFDLGVFRSRKSPEKAFEVLRRKTEEAGIFVLLLGDLGSYHSSIDAQTFRGFAIADKIAPFVVINDQDAKTAWCFTLLHEVTHLWLGQTGVSGSHAELQVEKFCNDVASEILFPQSEINEIRIERDLNVDSLSAIISSFAEQRNLSCSMVAYRLYRNGIIDEASWRQLSGIFYKTWLASKSKNKTKTSEGGPNFYTVRRYKIGEALLNFVGRTVSEGILTPSKAGKILGVKARTVNPLLNFKPGAKPAPEGAS